MADEQAFLRIDTSKFYAVLASAFGLSGNSGGQPDPEQPLKPGPWDPVVRVALTDVLRTGPSPEPWLTAAFGSELLGLITQRFSAAALGEALNRGEEVSLNPQPLPPAARFSLALGDALTARIEMLAEVSDAFETSQSPVGHAGGAAIGSERGIIIVGGYVSRLVDEFCGTGFRLRWPFPGPRPRWFQSEIGSHELLMLGASLNTNAQNAFHPAVQRALADAGKTLAEAGVARLQ